MSDLQRELLIAGQQSGQSVKYEAVIIDLNEQLEQMKQKMNEQSEQANQKLLLSQLQRQISDVKMEHSQGIARGE